MVDRSSAYTQVGAVIPLGNMSAGNIGGSLRSVIAQDTFSGNDGYGVVITGRAYGNRVFSSYIGAEILGVNSIPNRKGGVLLSGRAPGNITTTSATMA